MTLDDVSQAFAAWRLKKLTPQARITEELWDKVHSIQKKYSPYKISKTLGISYLQLKRRNIWMTQKKSPEKKPADFVETRFFMQVPTPCEITIQGPIRSLLIKIQPSELPQLLPQLERYL